MPLESGSTALRNGPGPELPAVDVHTHLAPTVESVAALSGVRVDINGGADGTLCVDGAQVGPAGLYDAAGLRQRMRQTGVDVSWVAVPPPFYRQGLPLADTARWVRAINDGLLGRLSGQSDLKPLGYLPFDQPEVALAEVYRLSSTVTGWSAAAGGGSLALDSVELRAVLAAVERSGRPLVLHPGPCADARLDRFYLANLLGNPFETAVAAAELVFGDVLARYPGLRVVLVHCGGVVAAVVGRWQRGLDTKRPGIAALDLEPQQAVRRLWVDTLAHDRRVVAMAAQVFGQDRLVLGSDYPFPMGVDDPWETVRGLAPRQQELAGRVNPAQLLFGVEA